MISRLYNMKDKKNSGLHDLKIKKK